MRSYTRWALRWSAATGLGLMASLVLGIGVASGAMLSAPPEAWDEAAREDKRSATLPWRGSTYSYDALAALRGGAFAGPITPEARRAGLDRCRAALDALAAALAGASPDAVVVVGGDGDGEALPYPPPAPGLAEVIGACARQEGFAVAADHVAGLVARRLLGDRQIPLVRLRFDVSDPRHDAQCCFAFGAALGRAVRAGDGDARVALIAAGGLSHPVIDEAFDRRILDALERGDPAHVLREPEAMFRAGAAETKTWIIAAGALDHAGLEMRRLDYVPCYRTAAGTGHAAAFAIWS